MDYTTFQQFLEFLNVEPTAKEIRAFRLRVLLFIMLISNIVASCVLSLREIDWNVAEGFYFIWMTMTTIGFGDYYPMDAKSQAFV